MLEHNFGFSWDFISVQVNHAYMETGREFCIGVYVVDMILAGCTNERIQEVKYRSSKHFKIKDQTLLMQFQI